MIYDYKSDELTQEVYIKCPCSIIEDIIDEYFTLRRYEHLSIYAPSCIAREIIGRLLDEIEDLWVNADSENELLYKNNNDVVITIGYDGMLFVEDARVNGVIKSNEDCCLTYFYDGLNKKDLNILEENAESILVFGFEDEDIKEENTELSTTSTTSYFIDGKEVNKDVWDNEHKKIVDEIEAFRRNFWNNWFMF